MPSQCSPDPEPGSSTGPGESRTPRSGPNEHHTDSGALVGRAPGRQVKDTDPYADSSEVWADIWREALQAGLATIRREPDSEDEW